MSNFLADPTAYARTSEKDLALILARFSDEYIFDSVISNIQNRFLYSQQGIIPNMPKLFESMFKEIEDVYTTEEYLQTIEQKKQDTYRRLIYLLCNQFNLSFNEEMIDSSKDLYSIAYYLYSFLVSDFSANIVTFYLNYISKEKNTIYDMMNLNEDKKNKDTATAYNKKLYKNLKMAIINANLEKVLHGMQAFDIDFETILSNIYQDKNKVKFISNLIQPNYDFYKTQIIPIVLFSQNSPRFITEIRWRIHHEFAGVDYNKGMIGNE